MYIYKPLEKDKKKLDLIHHLSSTKNILDFKRTLYYKNFKYVQKRRWSFMTYHLSYDPPAYSSPSFFSLEYLEQIPSSFQFLNIYLIH